MTQFGYDSLLNGRTNKYESNFFHIYLEGESPLKNFGYKDVSIRDYASFIHEYIHYIQQITTPYGLKYNKYFTNSLLFFREHIESNETLTTPILLEEVNQAAEDFKSELLNKNGSRDFSKGNIDDIEIKEEDITIAKENATAVNVGVYDFVNNRHFEEGFQFGYTCIMESMAHLVQSLINPELFHREIPYQSAQIICDKIRPDLKSDTKLLISICYTSLFSNNPGHAFFEILKSANINESGIDLFRRYMRDYSVTFQEVSMPIYRMMHCLMDEFIKNLQVLLGNDLIYLKEVMSNCKVGSSSGTSILLEIIYNENLLKTESLEKLLDFYGFPAIDSNNSDIVVPCNQETGKPYAETAYLLSLELIVARLKEVDGKKECIRYSICDRITRENNKELIDENCAEFQWNKKLPCLFSAGLSYWRLSGKSFV